MTEVEAVFIIKNLFKENEAGQYVIINENLR